MELLERDHQPAQVRVQLLPLALVQRRGDERLLAGRGHGRLAVRLLTGRGQLDLDAPAVLRVRQAPDQPASSSWSRRFVIAPLDSSRSSASLPGGQAVRRAPDAAGARAASTRPRSGRAPPASPPSSASGAGPGPRCDRRSPRPSRSRSGGSSSANRFEEPVDVVALSSVVFAMRAILFQIKSLDVKRYDCYLLDFERLDGEKSEVETSVRRVSRRPPLATTSTRSAGTSRLRPACCGLRSACA